MCEKYAGHDKYDHADQSRSRFCGRTTFLPSIVHTLRDFITPFLRHFEKKELNDIVAFNADLRHAVETYKAVAEGQSGCTTSRTR
ncbi:hypothetical protein Glove_85g128 [Diversispora epigaea]|uniref:Uncharacterized protein n=1 Tax=Diversispora epigaea TaxID=1348612 RepID=A0A397JHM4_9GLOM|nr:hypothetical protein Glove_85g128 [Diversispora epigaea]